ncbi:hypothetical protein [Massilia oculi]|uniref:hypothetical protein n=1 Tax=Massilia oculi TaxID=945844 RepID=UPI001AAFD2D8|nr:hypothetical protein [Massilia oculi]
MNIATVDRAVVGTVEGPDGSSAEVFVRADWSARFRGVRIFRSRADDATYWILPLPAGVDESEWHSMTFATTAKQVRLLLPNSVRIMNKAGQAPEIERRPAKPGDRGWDA